MRPAWFSVTADGSMNPSPTPIAGTAQILTSTLESHTLTTSEDTLPAIPYDLMWEDDRFWFPVLLGTRLANPAVMTCANHTMKEGRQFIGRADFVKNPANPDGWIMQRFWFAAVAGQN